MSSHSVTKSLIQQGLLRAERTYHIKNLPQKSIIQFFSKLNSTMQYTTTKSKYFSEELRFCINRLQAGLMV